MKDKDTNEFFYRVDILSNETQEVDGIAKINVLKNFYKDCGSGDIWNKVGLCRYVDGEGNVCWTTQEDWEKMMKNPIEKDGMWISDDFIQSADELCCCSKEESFCSFRFKL